MPFRLDDERNLPWYQVDLKRRYKYVDLYSLKGASIVMQRFVDAHLTTLFLIGNVAFDSIPYTPSNLNLGTTVPQNQYATWLIMSQSASGLLAISLKSWSITLDEDHIVGWKVACVCCRMPKRDSILCSADILLGRRLSHESH